MSRTYFRAKFAVYAFLIGASVPVCAALAYYLMRESSLALALGRIIVVFGPATLLFLFKRHFQYQLNHDIEEDKRHAEIQFPVVLMYIIMCIAGILGFCYLLYLLFPEIF